MTTPAPLRTRWPAFVAAALILGATLTPLSLQQLGLDLGVPLLGTALALASWTTCALTLIARLEGLQSTVSLETCDRTWTLDWRLPWRPLVRPSLWLTLPLLPTFALLATRLPSDVLAVDLALATVFTAAAWAALLFAVPRVLRPPPLVLGGHSRSLQVGDHTLHVVELVEIHPGPDGLFFRGLDGNAFLPLPTLTDADRMTLATALTDVCTLLGGCAKDAWRPPERVTGTLEGEL